MNRIFISIVLAGWFVGGTASATSPSAAKPAQEAAACSDTGASSAASTKAKVGFRLSYGDKPSLSMGAAESAPATWRLADWKGPVSATFSTQPDGALRIVLSVDSDGEKKKVKEATLKVGEAITLEAGKDVSSGYFGANPSILKIEYTGPYQPKS